MDTPYALLICNGEQPQAATLRELAARASHIVCADGGANVARRTGIEPQLIIGDFDSITRETREYFAQRNVELRYESRQSDTDFEKALLYLFEAGHSSIAVAGVTGGLLDHTLGNFSILLRHSPRMRMVLFDPHYRIDVITQSAEFAAAPGDRVSIVPLGRCEGVRYDGLRYALEGGVLAAGVAEGTCNEALNERFTVHLASGVLLVFRRYHEDMARM
jgi:thiamine pyrophosphokinase